MKIFKLAVAALLAALTALAAAGSLEEIRAKGVLRAAVYNDNFPYSYLSEQQMRGVDVDVARALAEKLGLGLSVMKLTASDESMSDDLRNAIWKGHYLGGGTADVMLHVPVHPRFAAENDQVTIFSPYLREDVMIAHSLDRIPDLQTFEPFFSDNLISVELESISDMFLARAENGRVNPQVRRHKAFTDACQSLRDGEAAALMATRAQIEACLDGDARFTLARAPTRVGLFTWSVGLAVKADNEALRVELAGALKTLQDDGSLEKIFAANGLTYTPPTGE